MGLITGVGVTHFVRGTTELTVISARVLASFMNILEVFEGSW